MKHSLIAVILYWTATVHVEWPCDEKKDPYTDEPVIPIVYKYCGKDFPKAMSKEFKTKIEAQNFKKNCPSDKWSGESICSDWRMEEEMPK